MSGHLENEIAVTSLVYQFTGRRLADRQPAQHKGSRTESHVLFSFLTLQAHCATVFGLAEFLFENHQFWQHPFQAGAGGFHATNATPILPEHTSGVEVLQRSPRVSVEQSSTRVERMIMEAILCRFSGARASPASGMRLNG